MGQGWWAFIVKSYQTVAAGKPVMRRGDLNHKNKQCIENEVVWLEQKLKKRGKGPKSLFRVRMVKLTSTYIAYTSTDAEIDRIYFTEIIAVRHREMSQEEILNSSIRGSFRGTPSFKAKATNERLIEDITSSVASQDLGELDFAVVTAKNGYQKGRVFIFRTDTEEDLKIWVTSIARLMRNQRELVNANQESPSRFAIFRRTVRWLYLGNSDLFQKIIAALIIVNFLVNIAETQLQPETGSVSAEIFTNVDYFFTWTFATELAINMIATMVLEFITDAWNLFDVVVVLVSVVSLFFENLPGMNVLRMLRAFRVFRLFRRIPSLKQILVALHRSLPAMSNAYCLLFLLTAIYSIMGVAFFSDVGPELFGDFFTAMFTMFAVLTGDQWNDVARVLFVSTGNPAGVAVFFVSYQLIVPFVMVNVVVAILLEEFGKAVASAEVEKEVSKQAVSMHKATRCPLLQISAELADHNDLVSLEERIRAIFDNVCAEAQVEEPLLTRKELDIGLKGLGYLPPVAVPPQVWRDLLVKQGLLEEDGRVGLSGFAVMLKQALRRYFTREVTVVMELNDGFWNKDVIKAAVLGLKALIIDREAMQMYDGTYAQEADEVHPEDHVDHENDEKDGKHSERQKKKEEKHKSKQAEVMEKLTNLVQEIERAHARLDQIESDLRKFGKRKSVVTSGRLPEEAIEERRSLEGHNFWSPVGWDTTRSEEGKNFLDTFGDYFPLGELFAPNQAQVQALISARGLQSARRTKSAHPQAQQAKTGSWFGFNWLNANGTAANADGAVTHRSHAESARKTGWSLFGPPTPASPERAPDVVGEVFGGVLGAFNTLGSAISSPFTSSNNAKTPRYTPRGGVTVSSTPRPARQRMPRMSLSERHGGVPEEDVEEGS